MNIQPIEKRDPSQDGSMLEVHGIFQTIQGEGPFCGVPCVFVRLAGCNLQCPACDTDYTSSRRTMGVADLCAEVFDADTRPWVEGQPHLVVVTGGEPFRQNLGMLFEGLVAGGCYVQVESNGTLPPTPSTHAEGWFYNLDTWRRGGVYVVCSPKTGKIHPDTYRVACALKYVVRAGQVAPDGLPLSALDHPSNPYPARPPEGWDRPVYVQPLDEQDAELNAFHARAAVASSLRHGYTLQMQVHKLVGVE